MIKRKLLAAAVAAAAVSGTASAFDPVATAPDYRIVISGATATEATLNNVISFDICDSDIDRFNHGTHWTIACVVKNIPGKISGLPAGGRKILFMKNNGGSGTGAGALQNHLPVEVSDAARPARSGIATNRCTGQSTITVGSKSATQNTGCPANLTSLVPDWGISDVEPNIFKDALAPTLGEGGPFNPNGPALNVRPLSQLPFGFAVTKSLYQALQAAQFAGNNACNPDPAPGGVDNNSNGIRDAYEAAASDATNNPNTAHTKGDTAACMPTLSRWEAGQMLKGSVPLSLVLVNTATGSDLFSASAGKAWETPDPSLYVCRRTAGSGTHAVTSMFYLGTQCGDHGRTMVEPADLPGQVFANSSSGRMDSCLNALETGAAFASSSPAVPAFSGHRWGVGYNSLEKNANLANGYRFVKIDGRAPNLVEVHDANYLETGALTIQIRAAQDYVNGAPAGDKTPITQMWNLTADNLNSPAGIIALNNGALFKHPFGDSGFLLSPDSTNVPDVTLNASVNPTGTFKRQEGLSAQDSCLEPQVGEALVTPIPVNK